MYWKNFEKTKLIEGMLGLRRRRKTSEFIHRKRIYDLIKATKISLFVPVAQVRAFQNVLRLLFEMHYMENAVTYCS